MEILKYSDLQYFSSLCYFPPLVQEKAKQQEIYFVPDSPHPKTLIYFLTNQRQVAATRSSISTITTEEEAEEGIVKMAGCNTDENITPGVAVMGVTVHSPNGKRRFFHFGGFICRTGAFTDWQRKSCYGARQLERYLR